MHERTILRRLLWWGLFWAWWTVFGVLTGLPHYFASAADGEPRMWWEVARISIPDLYSWGLVSLGVLWVSRRVPLDARRWPTVLATHLAAALFLLFARFWITNQGAYALGWVPKPPSARLLLYVLPWNVWMYLVMAGFAYGIGYYQRYRERELAATRLEAQLSQAQLQVLKMQLHPHFLFNTLHAISALMHRDVDAADRMVVQLSDLLRRTLDMAGTQEVSLREELAFLKPYLEIEETRFRDRLRVTWEIDPGALDAQVPHLILQPLVENAIRHGVEPHAAAGNLAIRARRGNEVLRLQVYNEGPGLSPGRPGRNGGVGLANTRARLEQLYGSDHRFALRDAPGGGVLVEITIPYHAAPNGGAAPEPEGP